MSRLVGFGARDFMALGDVYIPFGESGIVNLVGYNDSGKSAFTKIIEVLMYDAYSTEQGKFIHDLADNFVVQADFDDGVCIRKIKHRNGKSVWEMTKGDEMLFTNQLSDGVMAMSGVPDIIKQYFGGVEDEFTGEQLNVRRNTDKLFLIHTSGGDNYKIINSILRADVLAESVKMLNEDRNKLSAEVSNITNSVYTLKQELAGVQVIDDEYESEISTMMEKLRVSKDREILCLNVVNQLAEYNSIEVYDELQMVDMSRLTELELILQDKENASVPIYDECPVIDMERLTLLETILETRLDLDIAIYDEVQVVDSSRLDELMQMGSLYKELNSITSSLTATEKELEDTHNELHQLAIDHDLKICPNCKTFVA